MFKPTLVIVSVLSSASALAQDDGFQKARWGQGPEVIKRLYPKAERAGAQLAVKGEVAGRPALTTFSFTQGKLYRSYVVFTTGHFPEGVMIEACEAPQFEEMKSLLAEKYGHVKNERADWAVQSKPGTNVKDDTAKPEQWLLARFETKGTSITLGCNPSGLTLLYESKTLAKSANDSDKREKLESL